jgi:hypothetical protein
LGPGPPVSLGGIHTSILPRARLLTIYRHGAPAASYGWASLAVGAHGIRQLQRLACGPRSCLPDRLETWLTVSRHRWPGATTT